MRGGKRLNRTDPLVVRVTVQVLHLRGVIGCEGVKMREGVSERCG